MFLQQDKTAKKKKKKKRSSLNCFKGVDRAVENVLVAQKPPVSFNVLLR